MPRRTVPLIDLQQAMGQLMLNHAALHAEHIAYQKRVAKLEADRERLFAAVDELKRLVHAMPDFIRQETERVVRELHKTIGFKRE
jgi:hypothetical protein